MPGAQRHCAKQPQCHMLILTTPVYNGYNHKHERIGCVRQPVTSSLFSKETGAGDEKNRQPDILRFQLNLKNPSSLVAFVIGGGSSCSSRSTFALHSFGVYHALAWGRQRKIPDVLFCFYPYINSRHAFIGCSTTVRPVHWADAARIVHMRSSLTVSPQTYPTRLE